MAQATTDRISELRAKIEEIRTRTAQQVAEAQKEIDGLKTELATEVSNISLEISTNGAAAVAVPVPARRKPGPKPGSKHKPKHGTEEAAAPKKRGRPPKTKTEPKVKAKAKKGPKAANGEAKAKKGRGGGAGGAVFAKMIFDVLDRGKWPEVADLPKGAPGLTFSELYDTYLTGKMEKQQAHAALYDLKRRGLVERGDDKRNYVVEGAKME